MNRLFKKNPLDNAPAVTGRKRLVAWMSAAHALLAIVPVAVAVSVLRDAYPHTPMLQAFVASWGAPGFANLAWGSTWIAMGAWAALNLFRSGRLMLVSRKGPAASWMRGSLAGWMIAQCGQRNGLILYAALLAVGCSPILFALVMNHGAMQALWKAAVFHASWGVIDQSTLGGLSAGFVFSIFFSILIASLPYLNPSEIGADSDLPSLMPRFLVLTSGYDGVCREVGASDVSLF